MIGWRLNSLRKEKSMFHKTGRSPVISVVDSEKELKASAENEESNQEKDVKKEKEVKKS